jgi:ferredoxin--NADP+ reductase
VASLLEDAPDLVRRETADDPLAALRAEGIRPVEWAGWQAIERAEAELGARLGREVVKLPDWDALWTAARTAGF